MGGLNNWDEVVYTTAERFGGSLPQPTTSQAIAVVYAKAPQAVTHAIDHVAELYAQGAARSPWGLLKSRVERIQVDAPAAERATVRDKAIARAEQWMRTAGMHYDRWSEVDDELYGERGRIREHPNTRDRLQELWNELRPIGEQLDQDAIDRGIRYQQQPKIKSHTTVKTADELKAIAARKGADTTPLTR